MSGNNINRIFLARLAGTAVFDPNGDPVGKVRDAVATLRSNNQPPRILGLVVEVPLRRRVFVPITRVTSIEAGAVVITGLLNMILDYCLMYVDIHGTIPDRDKLHNLS